MYFQNTNPFSLHEIIPSTKRTVFISHYKGDIDEVNKFIDDNQNIFEPKALGVKDNDDFINSTDTD